MREAHKTTELGEIPESWEIQMLNDLKEENSTISYGVVQPGPEVVNGVLFIRGGDIKNGKIAYNLRTISKEVSNQYNRTLVRGGELLISLVGYPGECAITSDHLKEANIARQVGMVRIDKKINSMFVQQYLTSPSGKKNLLGNLVGSAQQVINLDLLRKVKIPIPPITEQNKIAEILSTVDDKIEVIEQQIEETETLKKGLMQRLLTKGIGHTKFKKSEVGNIPESWNIVEIGQISEVTSSKRILQSDYVDAGIPFYRGKEITQKSKGKSIDDMVFITNAKFKELSTKFGAPISGDILITAVGTVGTIYLVKENETFYFKDGNLIWLRNIDRRLDARFLTFYLSSFNFQQQIYNASNGSSQMALTIIKLKILPILVPPIEEQNKISEILDAFDEKLGTMQVKRTAYQQLKKALMQQLLTGKLRVNS